MRDFTKSLASFSWAMTAFGIQQTLNLFSNREGRSNEHPATEAFNNVTKATTDELDGFTESVFRAGNNLQQGLIDLTFELLSSQSADAGGSGRRAGSSAEDGVRDGRREGRDGCGHCGSGR